MLRECYIIKVKSSEHLYLRFICDFMNKQEVSGMMNLYIIMINVQLNELLKFRVFILKNRQAF